MIEFIDTSTGVLFDGNIRERVDDDYTYVFWFSGSQSTNIYYSQNICIYTDQKELTFKMNSNVFSLIDINRLLDVSEEEINSHQYRDINAEGVQVKSLTSTGEQYQRDRYIHMLYIIACSQDTGEFIDDIEISGHGYISVGVDVYSINEILQSNLSNLENTIPESIQRAIFDVNVREELNDNIILNRKYKELLMNYWNVVANLGSYNSLINSLKWFEWGDLVRIEEIWKLTEPHREFLHMKELSNTMTAVLKEQLRCTSKTTYIGLYYNLDKNTGELDSEHNPALERLDQQTMRWTLIDTCLKMTLLGSFFSTFFMPIHLTMVHSTVESWVFTNTIKFINSSYRLQQVTIDLINSLDLTYEYE